MIHARVRWKRHVVEPSVTRIASPPVVLPLPRPRAHCGNRASTQDPNLIVRLARGIWAHNLNTTRRTRARVGTMTKRGTTMTLRGQGWKHPEAACTTCSSHHRSKHRTTFLGTPPRSCTASPPSMSSIRRQPNFSQSHVVGKRPMAAAMRHHLRRQGGHQGWQLEA
jgi:hypothetical protein